MKNFGILSPGASDSTSMSLPAFDPQLLDAVSRGEPAARARLLDDWLPIVLSWCVRLGGSSVDAEDAAHDVLLILMDRADTIRDPSRFPGWLFGVTRNVVARHRRRAWLWSWVPLWETQADPSPTPADAYETDEIAARVQQVLDRLPAHQREVIVLSDLEERPDTEVAALLGIPRATVKSRLHRGRRQFREVAVRMGLFPVIEAVLEGGDP